MKLVEDYFNSEIRERKAMNKKLSKYIATFDYIDKTLIILSATSGGISIYFFFFCKCYWSSCRNSKFKFYSCIFLKNRINKKVLQITRNKKMKLNIIALLAKSKLNSTENLISQALKNLEISHEEFKTIVNEKENNERGNRGNA